MRTGNVRREVARLRRAAGVLVVGSGLALAGCDAVDAEDERGAELRATGIMADTLRTLAESALSAPERNPFLNRARAEKMARLLRESGAMNSDLEGRYLLAQEYVLSGQSKEAIGLLETLAAQVGASVHTITPQNRPLLELLAIANLRLGEQENCVDGTAANACILPLEGGARHKQTEGARKAVALYTALARAYPDDLGDRWLLNIAWMALGGYPDSMPAPLRIPGLAPTAAQRRAFPLFRNVAGELGVMENGLSGGVAITDVNGDGLLDIVATAWGMRDPLQLFVANGQGGYGDQVALSGVAGITGGLNVSHADFDNDGRTDLYIMRGAWLADATTQPSSLLRATGPGTFADVTMRAGMYRVAPTPNAVWGDFNRDGWVDLFVGHESDRAKGGPSHPSELWMNNRNGTFTEVSAKVGLRVDAFVKGAAWGDVNNDGFPDLYVSILGEPNRLYINRGGTFVEQAAAAGVSRPVQSFSTWFWDYDQDGWEDLMVLSYDIGKGQRLHDDVAREYLQRAARPERQGDSLPIAVESSRLYRNNHDGTFTDVTRAAGLADKVIFAMGSAYGDLDNDGWLDFYVGTGNPDLRSVIPNRMFRSVHGRTFEEVSLAGGFAHIQKGHAATFADLDRDGDEDIYMVMGGAYEGDVYQNVLFENPGWPGRHWVTLDLEGTTANRAAIGARVALFTTQPDGPRVLHRTVGSGSSFGSGTLQLHVGLDRATRLDSLRIVWPDAQGTTTTHAGLALDASYRVVQGKAPERLARPPVPFAHVAAPAEAMKRMHSPTPP
jgi:hypothetical protein